MADAVGMDLTPFFNQYLRDTHIPAFEYTLDKNQLRYRWNNCVDGFNIPLKIKVGDTVKWVHPTMNWKQLEIEPGSKIETDVNFYVEAKDISTK